MADQGVAVGPGWLDYHLATLDRGPRPLLRAACGLLGAGAGRTAIDLGCGAGADVLALLADGWSVVAVDRDAAGLDLLRDRVPAQDARQVRIVPASFAEVTFPRAHLIHAGYSVPFCAPEDFPGLLISGPDQVRKQFLETVAGLPDGRTLTDVRPKKVVYAILLKDGKQLTPDTLFPFSQVTLAHVARTLNTYGIDVEVIGIRGV